MFRADLFRFFLTVLGGEGEESPQIFATTAVPKLNYSASNNATT